MTQQNVTLTEFLLARIDEDAACARDALAEAAGFTGNPELEVEWLWAVRARPVSGSGSATTFVPQPYPHGAAHVLAQCEAKRRIIETVGWLDNYPATALMAPPLPSARVLRLLALPYADHPDYQEAWRP